MLKECKGVPINNKIQSVITAQKKIIDDCNSQLQLLRDWKKDRQIEQQKQQEN
jgi:hypothetical protein